MSSGIGLRIPRDLIAHVGASCALNTNIMAKLIFFCGKMAAGKSTLAKQLAEREDAVLLVQDELLDTLFPG